jgi:hypothetical protein
MAADRERRQTPIETAFSELSPDLVPTTTYVFIGAGHRSWGYAGESIDELAERARAEGCDCFFFRYEFRGEALVNGKKVSMQLHCDESGRVFVRGEKISGNEAIKRFSDDPRVVHHSISAAAEYIRVPDSQGKNRWYELTPEDKVLIPEEVK